MPSSTRPIETGLPLRDAHATVPPGTGPGNSGVIACPRRRQRASSAVTATAGMSASPAEIGRSTARRAPLWGILRIFSSGSDADSRNGPARSRRSTATWPRHPSASPMSRAMLRTYVPLPHVISNSALSRLPATSRKEWTTTGRRCSRGDLPRRARACARSPST